MANWCDNIVRFTGDKAKVAVALELFAQLEKDNDNRVIVIPDYITAENKAMIDISVQSDFIYYRSRWQPNLQALQQIADHFGVGFTNRYAEPDTYIWGEATYAEGHGEDIHLENEDFQRFHFDFDRSCYCYNGKDFDDDYEAFNAMLDDKIESNRLLNQLSR